MGFDEWARPRLWSGCFNREITNLRANTGPLSQTDKGPGFGERLPVLLVRLIRKSLSDQWHKIVGDQVPSGESFPVAGNGASSCG